MGLVLSSPVHCVASLGYLGCGGRDSAPHFLFKLWLHAPSPLCPWRLCRSPPLPLLMPLMTWCRSQSTSGVACGLLDALCFEGCHVTCGSMSPMDTGLDMAAGQRPRSGAMEPLGCARSGEHPSPAKWGSALADLQAMRGAGLDPAGTAVPARGLGFTQEGQRDTARKWSNPSPAAGRAPVTKPNGARPAERSRAPGSEIAFQGAGGRGNVAAPP